MLPNLKFFLLAQNFLTRQFRERWFQIWQKFFWNSSSKILKLDIFGAKIKDFYFALNFATRQIRGLLFQLWQCFLQILVGNYPNKALFGHKCKQCLYFWMKPLSIVKNVRTLILKTTIVFSNFSQKYRNTTFSLKTQKFLFKWKFEWIYFYLVKLNY